MRTEIAAAAPRAFIPPTPSPSLSHREILRLRVGDDDRRGRLLGVELVFLGERQANLLGVEQRQQLALVGEGGTSGIAEGVAAAAIALLQQRLDVARLVGDETQ